MAEFFGTRVLASREVRAVGRSDFIVAFVDAPAGDHKLQLLPDHLFLENGKRVFVGVEGRDPQQRGFIPVGTPSPPPPPPPPARPSVASEPPASTRDREDPARGGVTRQEDPSNGSTAMQVDPTPAPFPLISAADFQALVQQGEALMRLADRPPGTWGSQEQHWGRLAGPRLPSAMDIDSTGTTPETAPRGATPTAQQRQQQSIKVHRYHVVSSGRTTRWLISQEVLDFFFKRCWIVFFLFCCWNLQDQKVHRYVGSSQLGTSRNQPLCSTPEMSNTRYHSLPDAGQTRQMARRGSNMPPH